MKKIFRVLLVIIFVVLLWMFYGWSTRAFQMSSDYISETAFARISGTETNGTIEKILKNTQIAVSNNYLATVSYTTLDNQKITRDFRYAEEEISLDTQVHILYDPSNPLKAALKEDENYFKYTCYGALGFIALFTILLSVIAFLIFRLGNPKSNTVS